MCIYVKLSTLHILIILCLCSVDFAGARRKHSVLKSENSLQKVTAAPNVHFWKFSRMILFKCSVCALDET